MELVDERARVPRRRPRSRNAPRVALVAELAPRRDPEDRDRLAHLAAVLASTGAEVRIYSRDVDFVLPSVAAADDRVSVHALDVGPAGELSEDQILAFLPAFGDRLFAEFAQWRPTVIHADTWCAGVASRAVAARLGIPFVIRIPTARTHDDQRADDRPSPERVIWERHLISSAHRVIAVGAAPDEVLASANDPRRQVRIVSSDPPLLAIELLAVYEEAASASTSSARPM